MAPDRSDWQKRLAEAKQARQLFERAYLKARHTQKVVDYDDALYMAGSYIALQDGMIALAAREQAA